MSQTPKERLYHLLPAIYRQRDQLQGEPLRALFAGLESEFLALEADMDALYDNWFIETCDEEIIPFIADQVGIYGLDRVPKLLPSQRRQVANTLGYRRRKGLIATLEHIIQDVTGWHVRAVEYGQLVAITQHQAHLRPSQGTLVDLHTLTDRETLDGPFSTTAHTVDVRHTQTSFVGSRPQGKGTDGIYHLHNVGLFLWRLQSYLLTNVPACRVTNDALTGRALPSGCFTFDPLGHDIPLFNRPVELGSLEARVEAPHVPGQLSRTALARDLTEYKARHTRASQTDELLSEEDQLQNSTYYGPDRSVCVILNGQPIAPNAIISANLSHWRLPMTEGKTPDNERAIAIDVALGRLMFPRTPPLGPTDKVEVHYCYGFSGDLGGGPYSRELPLTQFESEPYRINVLKGGQVSTLREALALWETYYKTFTQTNTSDENKNTAPSGHPRCVIHIVDNGVYNESELVITLPKHGQLVIEATDDVRPTLRTHGPLHVVGQHASANLHLHGLLLADPLAIRGSLNLTITHCTLLPYGLNAQSGQLDSVQIRITSSIVGPIHIHAPKGELLLTDSIIDAPTDTAIDTLHSSYATGPITTLERVTIFGKVRLRELRLARDVLFTAPLFVQDQDHGLISTSYIAEHSQTPPRDRCQPDLTLTQPEARTEEQTWQDVHPLFTSTRYGDPAYAQLSTHCPPQITRGATGGTEMGAFSALHTGQRQDNLSAILDEYLPLGLTTSILYVT